MRFYILLPTQSLQLFVTVFNWSKCRGQCFDGASNMTGHQKGVATQIAQEEPRALFTHCYGHSLNLVLWTLIESGYV